MKLVSFIFGGRDSWGVVVEGGVVDAGTRDRRCPTLRAALTAGALPDIAGMKPDFDLSEVQLLPPIPDPDKIIGFGFNYRKHVLESGQEIPKNPSIFIRLANTLVGHGSPLVRPRLSTDLDYEVELAVIIGRGGRHIPVATAMGYVAGYSCFNDASVRDYQFTHSLAVGKNFVATGGFGPWIVTADEIPEPGKLTVMTRLNGVEVQHASTDDLIFDIPTIVSYCSSFTPLVPGDVIATGTPQGVGFARKPPVWLKPGDVVELEIERIGILRNGVVAEEG